MRSIPTITALCIAFIFLFSRCELMMILLDVETDNCERYSIYRTTIFGPDDLLWEETACDSDCYGITERFQTQLDYYQEIYSSSSVYSEHVTYSQ